MANGVTITSRQRRQARRELQGADDQRPAFADIVTRARKIAAAKPRQDPTVPTVDQAVVDRTNAAEPDPAQMTDEERKDDILANQFVGDEVTKDDIKFMLKEERKNQKFFPGGTSMAPGPDDPPPLPVDAPKFADSAGAAQISDMLRLGQISSAEARFLMEQLGQQFDIAQGTRAPTETGVGTGVPRTIAEVLREFKDPVETERQRLEEERTRRIEEQRRLIEEQFRPEQTRIGVLEEQQRERVSTILGQAGLGRGTSAIERLGEIDEIAAQKRAALDARKQAQLNLFEAELRGADAAQIKTLQEQVNEMDRKAQEAAIAEVAETGSLLEQMQTVDKDATELANDGTFYNSFGQPITDKEGKSVTFGSPEEPDVDWVESEKRGILIDKSGTPFRTNAGGAIDLPRDKSGGLVFSYSPAEKDLFGNITRPSFLLNKATGEFRVFDDATGESEVFDLTQGINPEMAIGVFNSFSDYVANTGTGNIIPGSEFHTGLEVDIDGVRGDEVSTYTNGTVKQVVSTCKPGDKSCNGGFGNSVVIETPAGISVRYAHLEDVNLKQGDKVFAGQGIGTIGITGQVRPLHADGSHLHIEARDRSGKLVPLQDLADGNTIVSKPVSIEDATIEAMKLLSENKLTNETFNEYIKQRVTGVSQDRLVKGDDLTPKQVQTANNAIIKSDAFKAINRARNSLALLLELEQTFEKSGEQLELFGEEAGELSSIYRATLLDLKEFFNLGVLNGPDLEVMESILADPTSVKTAIRFKGGAKSTRAGIEILKKKMVDSLQSHMQSVRAQNESLTEELPAVRDAQRIVDEVLGRIELREGGDEFESLRKQLGPGEILIERNGQIGAIPKEEFDPLTDKHLP